MTAAELVSAIEGENRGDDVAADAERPADHAAGDFAASVERRESVPTEAQLVAEINGEQEAPVPAPPATAVVASGDTIDIARRLLATATAMLDDPMPTTLRAQILTRLSAAMTLVGSL